MNLLQKLTEQTQELKEKFLANTRDWARVEFERICELAKWYTTSSSYKEDLDKYHRAQKYLHRTGYSIIRSGLEKFVAEELKAAEQHYAQSLEKLVFRLNKKGIVDGTDCKVTSAWVGVNLEIEIEHGGKFTRAWTIIAEGIVQRPHYRYLVR